MDPNDNDNNNPPPPNFFGGAPDFAGGVCFDDEDDYGNAMGEETTRRIGGSGFSPSFDPVSFADPQASSMGPSIDTAPVKAMVQSPSSLVSAWNIDDCPTLPSFHPLERTTTFCPFTSVSVVADRVASLLTDRDIEVEFDTEKSKAKCLTMDGVEFRVFLYKGQAQYNHGIIVEVQRRSGNSWNFSKTMQAILDAAEGKDIEEEDDMPMPPAFGGSEMDSDVSLSFVKTMISLNEHLALQTLLSMTDPSKMGESTAHSASRQLMTSELELGTKVLAASKKNQQALMVLYNVVRATSVPPQIRPMILEALDASEVTQKALIEKTKRALQ